MTATAKFELPSSGYDALAKILHAYAYSGGRPVSLDDVSSRAGMARTMVSKNHPFLVCIGLLAPGNRKSLTASGQRLALAVSNQVQDQISAEWARAMRGCEDTRKVLEMVQIQRGVRKGELPGRVLNSLGIASDRQAKTGANCLIDVFLTAGLIEAKDDRYVYNDRLNASPSPAAAEPVQAESGSETPMDAPSGPAVTPPSVPAIHIDIQIHIDANASSDQIDMVFASMAKHLYGRS